MRGSDVGALVVAAAGSALALIHLTRPGFDTTATLTIGLVGLLAVLNTALTLWTERPRASVLLHSVAVLVFVAADRLPGSAFSEFTQPAIMLCSFLAMTALTAAIPVESRLRPRSPGLH